MRLEQLTGELEKLSPEELRQLYQVITAKLAVTLHSPESFYDDWEDSEVDDAYAKTW